MTRSAAEIDLAVRLHLFDKTPHAYGKAGKWATRKEEFVKRAAFALTASLAVHDKKAPDANVREFFPLIARASTDDRRFVKKGVSWALRSIGHRNRVLRDAQRPSADSAGVPTDR